MDSYEIIEARFHFAIPEDYKHFWMAGLLSNDRAIGIRVSRHFWLSPDEIANCRWPDNKIKSIVPCARTPGRDHFCWFVETLNDSWIADCPRDSNFAEGIAPSFEAFVFRSLLEEFSDSWLPHDLSDAAVMFRDYAQRVGSAMRPQWVDILKNYASRSPTMNRWKRPSVISNEEFASVVACEIAFPSMNKQFRQNLD